MEEEKRIIDSIEYDKEIIKSSNFPNKVLIINGWEGCGKTCICNVFKSIDGVENMRYSMEMELISHLWLSKNLNLNAASTSLKMISDYIIYNLFQSREINIRPSDLSSIFRSPIWFKYIKRLFSKGGADCVPFITDRTILKLVTHNLYECNELIQDTFKERLIFIEVARDPIYMLSQLKYNQDTIYKNKCSPRNFTLNYKQTGNPIVDGLKAIDNHTQDNWETSLDFLERRMKIYFNSTKNKNYTDKKLPFFIFFEDFVKEPYPFISSMNKHYNIKFNRSLKKYLKNERIPRSHHSDGKKRKIYEKIGWVKLDSSTKKRSELDSYISYYNSLGVNHNIIQRLVNLSERYKEWKKELSQGIIS
tara:strand:+ start:844 stop:1929 length:1086 start_codon:yes stop_codon:yes gene_type:complete